MNTSSKQKPLIDPRGPRFGAAITSVLLLVTVGLGLTQGRGSLTLAERLLEPAFILLAILTGLFAWGAFVGIHRHPYGLIFRTIIRPRLAPPNFLEEPQPPTFAQLVGFLVAGTGIVVHLAGVPYGLVIAASAAFIASFLNAVFGLCLGCEMYGLLVRANIISPTSHGI
jgi:hypothetical protein